MKKLLLFFPILGLTVFLTGPANGSPGRDHKVTICHFPPGNPANMQTITIDWSAVPAHVANHGDYIGVCGADEEIRQ